MEGLRQIVFRPSLEAPEAVGLARATREDQHGQLGVEALTARADLTEDVDPLGIRESEIEQHQVGMVVAAEPQGVGSAGGRKRPVAVGGELVAEQLAGWIVILADDHRRQLFDLWKHAEMSAEGVNFSPSEVHRLDRVRRERGGEAIDPARRATPSGPFRSSSRAASVFSSRSIPIARATPGAFVN